MPKPGLTPWHHKLEEGLRAEMNERLDRRDTDGEGYEGLHLSRYCSPRSWQAYAKKRLGRQRRAPRTPLSAAGSVVQALTEGSTQFENLEMQNLNRGVG